MRCTAALSRFDVNAGALALIQEGLRGVVRIPGGTAHALDSSVFPIAVMGKTGTTNEFRDALFVGSTYGLDGITVAVTDRLRRQPFARTLWKPAGEWRCRCLRT